MKAPEQSELEQALWFINAARWVLMMRLPTSLEVAGNYLKDAQVKLESGCDTASKMAEAANKVDGDFWDYHTWRDPDQLETLKNSIQELREALLSAGYTEGDE